jgi:hypothetical protein
MAIGEVEQHTDDSLDAGGMVTIKVIRNAALSRRPPALTTRLQKLFAP